MKLGWPRRSVWIAACAAAIWHGMPVPFAVAQELPPLPDPLTQDAVTAYARDYRQEIAAARARVRAADQRPVIAAALEDPMVMPSVDHLPFMLNGADVSLMVEQKFPLSDVRRHQRQAAEAGARRAAADAERVAQNVQLEALQAFYMLHERREMTRIFEEQAVLARGLVSATEARYRSATGGQSDVLRAEIEVARIDDAVRAGRAEIAAAEAMLNIGLGRPPIAPLPTLVPPDLSQPPPAWESVREAALARRPELAVGRAEVAKARSDISVMESMYRPMAFLRTGPSYTMSDGKGWMITAGISIPLWRGKLDAGVREGSAMHDMAEADLAAMTLMIEGDAAAALRQVIAVRERAMALRDEIVPRARQAIDPSLAAFAVGTIQLAGVIDAAQALWGVQAEQVAVEYELAVAWARLRRAQGVFDPEAGS